MSKDLNKKLSMDIEYPEQIMKKVPYHKIRHSLLSMWNHINSSLSLLELILKDRLQEEYFKGKDDFKNPFYLIKTLKTAWKKIREDSKWLIYFIDNQENDSWSKR